METESMAFPENCGHQFGQGPVSDVGPHFARPRDQDESIDHFCRRRLRNARNVAQKVEFWSCIWMRRVLSWDKHVRQGVRYSHFCSWILKFHDIQWLQHQRSAFVSENSLESRNSILRGRTGTRLNISRPQPRWEESVQVVQQSLQGRTLSERGSNARTIGTIIREAVQAVRVFVRSGNQNASQIAMIDEE